MCFRVSHRLFRQLFVVVLLLCFTAGNVSASYHVCADDDSLPAQQEAAMAGMEDCASMNMRGAEKPVKEKKCCVDFTCAKCFPTPLAAAREGLSSSPGMPAAKLWSMGYAFSQHSSEAPERPPKA